VKFRGDLAWWYSLIAGGVVTLAYVLAAYLRKRKLDKIGYTPQLKRMMASLSVPRRVIKATLVIGAVTLCTFVLARPYVRGKSTWRKQGIDIVVAMDFSKSMLARDIDPSRVERMKQEVDNLFEELDSDRVSVVTFSGAAAHFPLTHDYKSARNLYKGLRPWDMPPGSDVGEALMIARCVARPDLQSKDCKRVGGHGQGGAPLPDDPEYKDDPLGDKAKDELASVDPKNRSQAIILFTDGGDTAGRARQEVQRAIDANIHVFIVGVGTTAGELIPDVDQDGNDVGWVRDKNGKLVHSKLEEAKLRELAELAGGEGHYFSVASQDFGTDALITQLRRLKRGDMDKRVISEPKEIYQWLLFPAFLMLLIEACISDRKRRVLYPEEHS